MLLPSRDMCLAFVYGNDVARNVGVAYISLLQQRKLRRHWPGLPLFFLSLSLSPFFLSFFPSRLVFPNLHAVSSSSSPSLRDRKTVAWYGHFFIFVGALSDPVVDFRQE